MQPVPINVAETIVEPFWDPGVSDLEHWTVDAGPQHGLKVEQYWCDVMFSWARKPVDGPAVKMSRKWDLDCSAYDRLIVSAMLPTGCTMQVCAVTDHGLRKAMFGPSPGKVQEYELPLEGASRITDFSLEIFAVGNAPQTGYLNWIGLVDSRRLELYQAQWKNLADRRDWDKLLKPESFEPAYTPCYGLWVQAQELDDIRRAYQERAKATGRDPLSAPLPEAPETFIREFLGGANYARFSRQRDQQQLPFVDGLRAAFAGLVLKDKRMLRYAARTALTIALVPFWDDGFMCYFPYSGFDQRCFLQTAVLRLLAAMLDGAGELLTPAGKDLILRRMAEHGLGNINFVVWKYDYIRTCNQLAAFSQGRIPAYIILEKHGWHTREYTELAVRELLDSLDKNVLPDGSFLEGSSYFGYTMSTALYALHAYAQGRGKELGQVIPECILRTAGFAEAMMTTADNEGDVIPFADAQSEGSTMPLDMLAYLACAMPESQWTTMFRRSLTAAGGMTDSPVVWAVEKNIPKQGPALPAFTYLREMGVMSSVREHRGKTVKIALFGNHAGAGHNHEDKGSFVLEFAGDVFAADPGGCNYSISGGEEMKHCQRHNMLTPINANVRPQPKNPIPVDIKPAGTGNARSFAAMIDLTPAWEGWFRKWIRTLESPTPDMLVIRDEYELAKGDSVDFHWHTKLPVEIQGNRFVVSGRKGRAVIQGPDGVQIRQEKMLLRTGQTIMNRISIRRAAPAGILEMRVKLE
jgi:hypothetical protein